MFYVKHTFVIIPIAFLQFLCVHLMLVTHTPGVLGESRSLFHAILMKFNSFFNSWTFACELVKDSLVTFKNTSYIRIHPSPKAVSVSKERSIVIIPSREMPELQLRIISIISLFTLFQWLLPQINKFPYRQFWHKDEIIYFPFDHMQPH